jgi:hypothetical protein
MLVQVGTTYTLSFVVFSDDGLVATAERLVEIVAPCGKGNFLCEGRYSEVRRIMG